MTPKHDIKTLPKWAQELIAKKEHELANLRKAHALLSDPERNWFTVKGHDFQDGHWWNLYSLSNSGAVPVCSIGRGAVLLVGHPKNKEKDSG